MQEAVDRYEKRRLLPRELGGEKQAALRESTELKYQMRLLFKLLGKQDEAVRGVCDDDAWVMQQFTEMLHVPRYALIKTCPLGDNEDFDFHPLIYEEKVYSKAGRVIRVTNCNDDSLITTLTGHAFTVQCLIIDDGKLYSGSYEKTIKVWDCSTNKLITTLTEHTDPVHRLRIHGGKLYSQAHDVIKVYDCSDDTLITTLEDHTDFVRCLEIHDGKLYTGSWDKTINVYDCSDDSLITTLRGHTDRVSQLTFQNGKLYSKQRDGAIYIWQL